MLNISETFVCVCVPDAVTRTRKLTASGRAAVLTLTYNNYGVYSLLDCAGLTLQCP